jgi:hypothetical protein
MNIGKGTKALQNLLQIVSATLLVMLLLPRSTLRQSKSTVASHIQSQPICGDLSTGFCRTVWSQKIIPNISQQASHLATV